MSVNSFAILAFVDELWELVRGVPVGKVVSYGALGSALSRPLTGRVVGRLMASCPDDIPWWRVVAKSGALPIWKRGPAAGARQEELLRQEGVPIEGGIVDMSRFSVEPY